MSWHDPVDFQHRRLDAGSLAGWSPYSAAKRQRSMGLSCSNLLSRPDTAACVDGVGRLGHYTISRFPRWCSGMVQENSWMLVYSISTMVTMVGGHGDHGSYFQICTLTRPSGKHFSTFPSRFSRSVHRSCIFFRRHCQKQMICIYRERYIYMSIYRYGQTYSIYPSKPYSSYQFSTSRGFNVFQLLFSFLWPISNIIPT